MEKYHKFVEIKQYILKQPMGERRNPGETKKYYQSKKQKQNTTYQNLWITTKVVLRGKFLTVMYTIRKKEDLKSIHNITRKKKSNLNPKLAERK